MSEPAWVALGSPAGSIDYEGAWAAGTAYVSGDVVRHNGVEYIAVNPSTGVTPALAASAVGVPYPVVNGQFVKGSGGAVVWSSIIETDVRSLKVADTDWVPITVFYNGWHNYGTGYPPARVRMLATGLVVMSGLLAPGTNATDAFQLPNAKYYPDFYRHCGGGNGADNWGTTRVQVGGQVHLTMGTVGWMSIDGVNYYP